MSNTKVDHQEPLIEQKSEHVSEVLNKEQVNACLNMIEDIHPIKGFHITRVMPWLYYFRCCLKKEKKDFRHGLKKTLLAKMDMQVTETDQALHDEPMMILGFGLNSYLDITWLLMCKFLVIQIFFLPIVFIYSNHDALANYDYYTYSQYSLGNLGGSSTVCNAFPISLNTATIACPAGVINGAKFFSDQSNKDNYVGLISTDSQHFSYCSNEVMNFTSNSDGKTDSGVDCSSYVDYAGIFAELTSTKHCDGAGNCQIDLSNVIISADAPIECQVSGNDSPIMFVQVPCIYTAEELQEMQTLGLVIGTIAVFVSLFTMVYNDYIKVTQIWGELDYDVKTVTAGDYSIEFDISEESFANWKQEYYEGDKGQYGKSSKKSANQCFKYYIEDHFNKIISELPHLDYDDGIPKIANVTLAYHNAEVIKVLKDRGQAIKHEDYDKMREFDHQLQEMKDTYEEMQKITTPCSVFLTFETEEGYQRAVQFNETCSKVASLQHYSDFFGHEIEIQEAAEPSDILWENRMYTEQERKKRTVQAAVVIFISLIISLVLIIMVTVIGNTYKFKYGNNPDCTMIYNNYQFDITSTTPQDGTMLLNQAYKDIMVESYQDGVIQCFCDYEVNYAYIPSDQEYDIYGDGTTKYAVCSQWESDYYIGYAATESVSFTIIIINMILKEITVRLVERIGHETKSEQMTYITNYVFYSLFLNTGFVIVMAYANLTEQSQLLGYFFNTYYYDYQPGWYANVGYLMVYTMIINMVMAPGMAMVGRVQQWMFRKMDRSWGNDIYVTKQTSMQCYVDLYSGPDYIVHGKYPAVLNVVFVTMPYGVGLPILFPVCFVTLLFIYITEKIELAYNYQLPSTMDDTLTKNCVELLRFTPIIFVMNGYWMLSNQQYFNTTTYPISYSYDEMLSGHTISDCMSVNQASPLLIMVLLSVVVAVLELNFSYYLKKWGMAMSSVDLKVDEDLPKFFEALKLKDCDYMVNEHHYYLDNYGIEILTPHVADKLDDTKIPLRPIQGTPFYNIIANREYMRAMYYIDNSQPDREAQIKDDDDNEDNDTEQSDMVVLMLNLGFIPDKVAIDPFKPGFNKEFKRKMHDLGLIDDEHFGHKTKAGHHGHGHAIN